MLLTRRHVLYTAASACSLFFFPRRPLLAQTRPATPTSRKTDEAISRITALAVASPIATYPWLNRSKAPAGYLKGLSVAFAKLHYDLSIGSPYAREMAKPCTPDADPNKDALKHYEDHFQPLGLDNTAGGPDTLRHLFVLLLGLGMRESSGRYCEGRDHSARNTTAETAEAGLFQTSFNARHASPLMPTLFADFQKNPLPSYLDLFKEGVRPKPDDLENYGEGDGRDFQKLSKENPFFATSFAALGLRNIRKHWGPINRKQAELKPDADALFKEIQTLTDQDHLGPLL